jgi:DNA polymerase I-like protein with 3'-5' exonuclease and polymerase domains
MRCSYNVVGTKFGRWSSAANAFGTGTNLQNITDEMREIFIPDEGWKLAYADLEQAESVCVAYLSNDANYKAAIKSGDLHTYVCRLIFPHLKWTGNMKEDKEIAKLPFYRMFDHRDIAKRGGHATNYYAKAHTVAHRLRLPRNMAEVFQNSYFSAFPGIRDWQASVGRQLGAKSSIKTPLGRKIIFFDRTDSEETLRAAIAAGPQSMCGDVLNVGLHNTWKFQLEQPKLIKILAQVHDAIVFQYRPEYEVPILQRVLDEMTIPVPVESQGLMTIKTEVLIGWNWRKMSKENPLGITKWTPGERDKRNPPKEAVSNRVLDRRVCSAHKPFILA